MPSKATVSKATAKATAAKATTKAATPTKASTTKTTPTKVPTTKTTPTKAPTTKTTPTKTPTTKTTPTKTPTTKTTPTKTPTTKTTPTVKSEATAPEVVPEATPETPVVSEKKSRPEPREFDEVLEDCVSQAKNQITQTRALVKTILEARRSHDRALHKQQVLFKKARKAKSSKKVLTGFAKPCLISDDLADFLNEAGNKDIVRGSEMTRHEVTKRLNTYLKEHDLRNQEDKRIIQFRKDPKLVKLFNTVQPDQTLTYFNLQTYLKDKFVKPVKTE